MGEMYKINDGGLHHINTIEISGGVIGSRLKRDMQGNFVYMSIEIIIYDKSIIIDDYGSCQTFHMHVFIEDEKFAKRVEKITENAEEIKVHGSIGLREVYEYDIRKGDYVKCEEICIVADSISVLLTHEQRSENMGYKKRK